MVVVIEVVVEVAIMYMISRGYTTSLLAFAAIYLIIISNLVAHKAILLV